MASFRDRPISGNIRCLRFENVAPGRPYHAALSITRESSARGFRVTEHSHDFYEMIFVLVGDAIHGLNGTTTMLREGELTLLQPGDRHFIRFQTGRFFHYINIAIDAEMWRNFHDLAGIGTNRDAPVIVSTTNINGATDECASAFRHALVLFQDTQMTNAALRTEACRLLATVAPWLFPSVQKDTTHNAGLPDGTPGWLIGACAKLRHDSNALRCGLPAFVAEAGVTRTHLARILKAATNQTPTEYINRLRLEHAARLLTTTTLSILDIAGECGFGQPAYFYRLFGARFQTSPHAYRIAAARRVSPERTRKTFGGTF
ncbi:MAG: AraC family transcriptional regulator [Fibrella sp.]|nr:AraC family transcriptional regulator [Armatimonadota bacterium]